MTPTIYEPERPVSGSDLDSLERRLSIKLPPEYRNWLSTHNGGRPEPAAFSYKDETGPYTGGVVAWFFAVYDGEFENFESEYRSMKLGRRRRLLDNLVPIARDPFGNLICMSFGGPDRGKIYLWDHEDEPAEPSYANCHLIADTFDQFIDSLHD